MSREKVMNILKENESLKIKIDRLNQSTERLQQRYNDAEKDIIAYQKKHGFLKDQFREIVRNCFPREYIQNDMKNFSEMQLYDYIVERVTELESQNFYSRQEKEKIEGTLDETMKELERLQNAGPIHTNNEFVEGDEEGEVTHNTSVSGIVSNPKEVEGSENPVAGVMSLIEDREWPVIKIIGDGETLFSGIVKELGVANSTVSGWLNELVDKGVINFERIQKGGKGRPAHHYFLTGLGVKAYEMKYNEAPETTTLEKMSTHGSPEHGGLMVEVGTFLQENNCDVEYDGPDTTFTLKDGRKIIFDIKAYDKESKEMLLIETERAKCGDQHLRDKFDKCYEFTKLGISKTVHIVAPEKETLHRIQQQLFRWVRSKQDTLVMLQKNNIDNAVVIFKTATLEDFKKGKLQIFYYGVR